jgi:hypothetical protein
MPDNYGGHDMKVKELIAKLQEIDQELNVVLTINDDGISSWTLQTIDLGWEPSGVVSLESNECIMC